MSPVIPQKGERFTIPGKYLLFILTIVCISLVIVSFNSDALSKPLNAVCGGVITPLQNGIANVGGYLNKRKEELSEIKDLLKENEELRQLVGTLTMENIALSQERYELTRLRMLYDLDDQYSSYKTTGARVIAKDSGNWYHSFVINKGSKDGVELDMNVIADGGLVGRVTDVGPHWAKVMSIIDDGSNVSAMVLSTSDNMIISGDLTLYEDGLISFEKLIDKYDRVSEGDKVVTSNISDKYLPGILIGYVTDIAKDSNNLTKSGSITPVVDFEHLEEVLVVLQVKDLNDEDADDVSAVNE